MSFRLFEKESHAKIYVETRPSPPIELIQSIVSFVKQKIPLTKALDLGCGSGQCTFVLANFFEQVLGIDISQAQIQEAKNECSKRGVANVQFEVSAGEVLQGVADKSIQLVTICTAAHYLDMDKVYEEGRRILVPGGVMAIFCTGVPEVHYNSEDAEKDTAFRALIQETHQRFYNYFAEPAKGQFESQYRNITIPYNDLTRGFDFLSEREVSLEQICAGIRSLSMFHLLAEAEGMLVAENLLTTFIESTKKLLNSSTEFSETKKAFKQKFSYFLVMARV